MLESAPMQFGTISLIFKCKDNYFLLYYCTLIVIFFSYNLVQKSLLPPAAVFAVKVE